jgi:hypothetical protein
LRQAQHPGGESSGVSPKLKAGLGTGVSFAPANPSDAQVLASINSVHSFIEGRSGLQMSDQVKARLTQMETDTLSGAEGRIGIRDYVSALTDTLVNRLSTVTDEELSYALATLKTNDRVSLRADGSLSMTEQQFFTEATTLRELCRKNDSATRSFIQSELSHEVHSLISKLSGGLPTHFGSTEARGLTPAQATIVTYAFVTDDDLAFSTKTITNSQPFITGAPGTGKVTPESKAYGPNGRLFSTPADLLFNEATMINLLDHLAKGGS